MGAGQPEPSAPKTRLASSADEKEQQKKNAALFFFVAGIVASVLLSKVHRSWVAFSGPTVASVALGYRVYLDERPRSYDWILGIAVTSTVLVLLLAGSRLATRPMTTRTLGISAFVVAPKTCPKTEFISPPRFVYDPIYHLRTLAGRLVDASAVDFVLQPGLVTKTPRCSDAETGRLVLSAAMFMICIVGGLGLAFWGALQS